MSASIDFDVPAIGIANQNYGDPFAKLAAGGFGKEGGGGIGNVPGCCGIGDETGRPGISGRIGGPTMPAQLTYRVEPEFSEEARKAKFQGMVVLMIEIGVDGRAHNLKVVQPIGLGLDQKAIDAVSQWRFRPAQRGGKPLASTVVAALVEGNSIRATVRMTGVAKNTIVKLLVELGSACSDVQASRKSALQARAG